MTSYSWKPNPTWRFNNFTVGFVHRYHYTRRWPTTSTFQREIKAYRVPTEKSDLTNQWPNCEIRNNFLKDWISIRTLLYRLATGKWKGAELGGIRVATKVLKRVETGAIQKQGMQEQTLWRIPTQIHVVQFIELECGLSNRSRIMHIQSTMSHQICFVSVAQGDDNTEVSAKLQEKTKLHNICL